MSSARSARPHSLSVSLQRDGVSTPWGIRIVGGCDLGAPIVVTKVQLGSPADKLLQCGDVVKKINDYDARDLRHEDVHGLFKSSGSTISLIVERDAGRRDSVPAAPWSLPHSGAPTTTSFDRRPPSAAMDLFPQQDESSALLNQPYRTTPLVLPGAKVKKDSPSNTMSYLRHHPNPLFRAAPPHYDSTAEVLMKQKVADTVLQRVVGEETTAKQQVVHKQFNSPIGLYSEQNIADTIRSQTGVTPVGRVRTGTLNPRNQAKASLKKAVNYDPAKSETYKALQEAELGDAVQEVTVPVQHKVFAPHKPAPSKPAPIKLSALGTPEETIHQSGSFKRLMYAVLGES
ncbi:PDZ and LIM domain protein 3 [Bacillus rossius redtenbacheri]|uniref:PDZ and LIM domain protein 3 n=1 Tax=Bacillus rossius redtenbacheri TaxID=93214 RepID=UPI002FDDF88E